MRFGQDAIDAAILARRLKDSRVAHRYFERAGDAVYTDARALHEFAQTKLWLATEAHRRRQRDSNRRFLTEARALLERVVQLDAPTERHAWGLAGLGACVASAAGTHSRGRGCLCQCYRSVARRTEVRAGSGDDTSVSAMIAGFGRHGIAAGASTGNGRETGNAEWTRYSSTGTTRTSSTRCSASRRNGMRVRMPATGCASTSTTCCGSRTRTGRFGRRLPAGSDSPRNAWALEPDGGSRRGGRSVRSRSTRSR